MFQWTRRTRSCSEVGPLVLANERFRPRCYKIVSRNVADNGLKESNIDRPGEFVFFDDFFSFDATATVGAYSLTKDGDGSAAAIDSHAGAIAIINNGTTPANNDENYVRSQTAFVLPTAVRKVTFECRLLLTEQNVDDANIICGLSNGTGADALLDDGGGPAASYDGFVFFKVDGGTVWQFEGSNATTQDTNTNVGAHTSGSITTLRFTVEPKEGDSLTAVATPSVNGVGAGSVEVLYSGLANMNILLGVKAGAPTQAETLTVDYVRVTCDRV